MTVTRQELVALSSPTVLVVDDNVANLKVISQLLQEEGCRVLTARDGKSGLEKAHHGQPNLILLDVMMPEMDGFEACYHLQADETLQKIPIIFMTALAGIDDKIRGFKLGAVDYITKPFQPEEVLARVRTHLRLYELTENLEQVVERRTHELQQEIIEREKAQEQLKESERRYSEIVEGTDDLITEVDSNGRFTFVNATARKIFGVSPQECVGLTAFDFVHPEDIEITRKSFQQWQEDKRSNILFENRQVSKTGRITDVHWTINQHFDEKGDVASIRAIARDVTEQKKAETKLRESEIKFRTMMESFADPLYICSPDFKVDYMNPAMLERLGRDATGEPCHSAMHGLKDKCEWCVFHKLEDIGRAEYDIRSPLDQRDYRVTNMPIHNPDGSISKMTIFKDITDYLIAVQEKEKAQSLLVQAQKMEAIGTLAGGIAHDFNNLLGVIIGQTELIELFDAKEKDNPILPRLSRISEAAERAKHLVQQILMISRQREMAKVPVDLIPLVKEVISFIRSSAPSTIAIRTQLTEDKAIVLSDASRIHQIFLNLCTNAVQAMEESGGALEISLESVELDLASVQQYPDLQEGLYVMIVISDTGPGVPERVREKIFEPYFTTKNETGGTGLGLAVVHGIVKSLQGQITLYSEEGKGSTFRVLLPQSQISQETDIQEDSSSYERGDETIMLVDDNEMLLKTGSDMLQQLGYEVIPVNDSSKAVEEFKAAPDKYHLVITDLTMPKLTGIDLYKELNEICPGFPVILCSGFGKGITEEAAKDQGFKAFLYKPINLRQLATTLREILDNT